MGIQVHKPVNIVIFDLFESSIDDALPEVTNIQFHGAWGKPVQKTSPTVLCGIIDILVRRDNGGI